MKKFIYYAVRALCALPSLLTCALTILSFILCFEYWWLIFVMVILGVTTIKLMSSYDSDVEEFTKLIEKIRDDKY